MVIILSIILPDVKRLYDHVALEISSQILNQGWLGWIRSLCNRVLLVSIGWLVIENCHMFLKINSISVMMRCTQYCFAEVKEAIKVSAWITQWKTQKTTREFHCLLYTLSSYTRKSSVIIPVLNNSTCPTLWKKLPFLWPKPWASN